MRLTTKRKATRFWNASGDGTNLYNVYNLCGLFGHALQGVHEIMFLLFAIIALFMGSHGWAIGWIICYLGFELETHRHGEKVQDMRDRFEVKL